MLLETHHTGTTTNTIQNPKIWHSSWCCAEKRGVAGVKAGDGVGSLSVVSFYGAVASQGKRPFASNCRFRISSASSRAIFPCSGESSGSAKPVRCIQRSQLSNCLACVIGRRKAPRVPYSPIPILSMSHAIRQS